MSSSSTAPSRPSKIDQTGVPSTAASRIIVPPAEDDEVGERREAPSVDRVLGHDQARVQLARKARR